MIHTRLLFRCQSIDKVSIRFRLYVCLCLKSVCNTFTFHRKQRKITRRRINKSFSQLFKSFHVSIERVNERTSFFLVFHAKHNTNMIFISKAKHGKSTSARTHKKKRSKTHHQESVAQLETCQKRGSRLMLHMDFLPSSREEYFFDDALRMN